MTKRVLDTNRLVSFWYRDHLWTRTANQVREAAQRLIRQLDTNAIVTPVYIEMVAGAQNQAELVLTRVFLNEFQVIDGGRIPEQDWAEARRLAEWIGRDGKRRHLGDCLIRAIANRLSYEVSTADRNMA